MKTYFEKIDAELTTVLLGGENLRRPQDDEDAEEWFLRVKGQIKDMILESYRNGQKAGLKPKAPYKRERKKPQEPKWADSEEQAIADLEERLARMKKDHQMMAENRL